MLLIMRVSSNCCVALNCAFLLCLQKLIKNTNTIGTIIPSLFLSSLSCDKKKLDLGWLSRPAKRWWTSFLLRRWRGVEDLDLDAGWRRSSWLSCEVSPPIRWSEQPLAAQRLVFDARICGGSWVSRSVGFTASEEINGGTYRFLEGWSWVFGGWWSSWPTTLSAALFRLSLHRIWS